MAVWFDTLSAVGRVVRSLVRLGLLGGNLPSLLPAVDDPSVGYEGDGSDHR